jgi:hypothetical protein
MLDRDAAEGAAMPSKWRQLADDRKQAWADHRQNFGQTQNEESADDVVGKPAVQQSSER